MPPRRPVTAIEANLHAKLEFVLDILWRQTRELSFHRHEDNHYSDDDEIIGGPIIQLRVEGGARDARDDGGEGEGDDDNDGELYEGATQGGEEDEDEDDDEEDEDALEVIEEEEEDRDFPPGRIVEVTGFTEVMPKQGSRKWTSLRYEDRFVYSIRLSDGTTLDNVKGTEIQRHNDGRLDDLMVLLQWPRDTAFRNKMAL
jgi:hypothetical protein